MSGMFELQGALQLRDRIDQCWSLGASVAVLGFWVFVCFGLLTPFGWAAENGSIRGVVQQQGESIAEHRVMLIRFGPNREVQRTPGQTDTQGRFVFAQLETGQDFEYVVGIRHAGQLYQSAPIQLLEAQHRTGIIVQVGQSSSQTETGSTQPFLHIANHMKVIVWRHDRLEVREIVRIMQPGTASAQVSGPDVAVASLHMPLPRGYVDLVNIQGLAPEHVRLSASGFTYTAALTPGEQRIMYTYALPVQEQVTTILLERILPTAALDILVANEHLAASSDLQFGGQVLIEPHTFLHFRGTNLAPHTRSWLQLTRKSAAVPFLRTVTYGFIISIVFVGIGLPVAGTWRGRRPQNGVQPLVAASVQALYATRLQVLQTIARLDDQYDTGILGEEAYRQQRRGYKRQLLEVAEQLQQSWHDREDVN